MISARYGPVLFGFILSGLMSLLVSGISTFRAAGLSEGVLSLWMGAWLTSWVIAFPAVLIVAPTARQIVVRLVRDEQAG